MASATVGIFSIVNGSFGESKEETLALLRISRDAEVPEEIRNAAKLVLDERSELLADIAKELITARIENRGKTAA